ncbi:dihydrolipoyl dehydrogenase [Paenibacillus sp. F411]|uniref:dihydrolipoyl dehydrogenase n=1 Tax=Paenibacillus sp. F411 TaxID=2820239 RepID=UPI001AAEC546|nr:dihydrolipoyl dehydrogenase [Paenibacillus sp. F411]MBO2945098.1 dihydrolipoyl dehydrogenase [Paenibacillus sp. F411]
MTITCDVAVLGGGTGGYTAAIRAAQLGKSVVLIEQDKLGGTCLHRGCIPSKALLRSAEMYAEMNQSEAYGIEADGVRLSFSKVLQRKDNIVGKLHQGVQYLMSKNKIQVIYGKGRVIGPSIFSPRSGAVAVELPDGEMETVVPSHLIIATGSSPRELPGLVPDGQRIMDSSHALQMERLPESILIVGGGVIGVEWASMLNDFGVRVTLVEAAPRLLPAEDEDISRELRKHISERGVNIWTDAYVQTDTYEVRGEEVCIQIVKDGVQHEMRTSTILVSVGRKGNADQIGLENTDVSVTDGVIAVNKHMQTTEPHIYAIGDVIGGLQLAHAAAHEGLVAVQHLAGQPLHPYRSEWIPRCVYTRPETASVGLTEKEAKAQNDKLKISKIPFSANGKALIQGAAEGFCKVIANAETDDILGVHIIGPHATEFIGEAALAQVLDAAATEVGYVVHSHPTLSEIVGEAMLHLDGRAIGI